jgi:hypothetical protein
MRDGTVSGVLPRTAFLTLLLTSLLLGAAPARAALPALSADGDRIVDATGREVLLRGAELKGTASRRAIQSTGWNVVRVRLGLNALPQAERLVDALAAGGVYSILVLPDSPLGLSEIAARFAARPHVAGFVGLPVPGKLLFNPVPVGVAGVVAAPDLAVPDAMQAARAAAGAVPVVATWPSHVSPSAFLGAGDGLRMGMIATGVRHIDRRGPLARAYVRAAPGRLEFSHYDEPRGHFAARGEAARTNTAPVEIFYPGAKHKDARFRARGLSGLRATPLPGGGRMVTGVPRGRWSFQIGPSLT